MPADPLESERFGVHPDVVKLGLVSLLTDVSSASPSSGGGGADQSVQEQPAPQRLGFSGTRSASAVS